MNEYKLPDIVDYPLFFNVRENSALFNNLYSYVIKPYPIDSGYSLYIGFRDGYIFMRLSDFKSNKLNMSDSRYQKILKHASQLFNIMKASRIIEACFYFADINNPILVDVMLSANKFMGPGMIRDVFSKTVPTQEISEIVMISTKNYGDHSGKYIKPSKFKYIIEDKCFRPLYGMIK